MSNGIRPHNEKPASVWNSSGAGCDEISRGIAESTGHCVLRLDPKPDERALRARLRVRGTRRLPSAAQQDLCAYRSAQAGRGAAGVRHTCGCIGLMRGAA